MATHTLPSFSAARSDCPWEPAFFVRFPHEGTVYVVGFDSIFELTQTLVNESVDGRLVERMIDFAEESIEWHGSPPVAEAVCDAPIDEPAQLGCDCELCRRGYNATVARLEADMSSLRNWVSVSLFLIAAVAWFV